MRKATPRLVFGLRVLGWMLAPAALLAACNSPDRGGSATRAVEGRSFAVTHTLSAAGFEIDPAGFYGEICLEGVGCSPGLGAKHAFTNLPQGTRRLHYGPAAYGGTIGHLTVSGGTATLETDHFDSPDPSHLVARVANINFDCGLYRQCRFGFDGTGVGFGHGTTATMLRSFSYPLVDYGSSSMDPALLGPHGMVEGRRFHIDADGNVDVTAFDRWVTWDAGTRSLRPRTITVTIDFQGYPSALAIGGDHAEGPVHEYTVLRERRYRLSDYGSLDPVRGNYHFSETPELTVDGADQLQLNTDAQLYFRHFPIERRLEARVGTITAVASGWFLIAGYANSLQSGGDGLPVSRPMLLGRRYHVAPVNQRFDFRADGSCSQTSFALPQDKTLTLSCSSVPLAGVGNCAGSEGSVCDDENPCTSGDVCRAGVCAGTAVADGTACIGGHNGCGSGTCHAGACSLISVDACRVSITEPTCEDVIEDPVSAEATAAARQGFNWAATQPAAEVDAIGRPALHYGRVYVRTPEQARLLDELLIHHDPLPLFPQGTRQPNRCGTLVAKSDATGGVLTHVVIPGALYNAIRNGALEPNQVDGDHTAFEMIELLSIPEHARNSVGALSYEFLGRVGFRYRPGETRALTPLAVAEDHVFLFGGFVDFLKDAARAAVNLVDAALGAVDELLIGTAKVTINLQVRNRDGRFGVDRPLTRAWGPAAGEAVGLRDVRVTLYYPGGASTVLGAPIEVAHSGTTDINGRVVIEVPKRLPLIRFTVRHENEAARIFSSPVTDSYYSTAYYGELSFLSGDRQIDLSTDDRNLHALAQFTDGYDYLLVTTGKRPTRAEVLSGALADLASPSGRAFAPCFGFENITRHASLAVLLASIPGLPGPAPEISAPVLALLAKSDIVLPTRPTNVDRIIPVHEYGHFALCSLLMGQETLSDKVDAVLALSRVTWHYLWNEVLSSVERDDEEIILFEAFADFFASQVASGVAFGMIPGDTNGRRPCPGNSPSGVCLEPPGLEENFSGRHATTADTHLDYNARVHWAITLLHDAFDGHDSTKPVPSDADHWTRGAGPPIVGGNRRYADSCGKGLARNRQLCDEPVALEGHQLNAWIRNWIGRGRGITYHNFIGGLAETARSAGYTWCDRCRLFAAHVPGLEALPANSPRPPLNFWQACVADPEITSWIGAPPRADLLMDSGTCVPCQPGEVLDPNFSRCVPQGTMTCINGCSWMPGTVPLVRGTLLSYDGCDVDSGCACITEADCRADAMKYEFINLCGGRCRIR